MSTDRVKEYLKKWNRDKDVLETQTSTATVPQAAAALGVMPGRIAKSITLRNGQGGGLMLVTSGDTKIDNKSFKRHFGISPRMLNADETYNLTAFVIGGVCPFGLPPGVEVYLDSSLQRFTTVFPACGSSNSMIEVNNDELFKYSLARDWVEVCKVIVDNSVETATGST